VSISKIRENARAALAGKWGKGACIVLAYLAIVFAMGFIVGLFEEDSLIGSLIDLATAIISVPLAFGISFAFIKLKRNEEVKAFDFLELGFSNFGRAWKIGLREILKVILPLILLVVATAMLVVFVLPTVLYSITDVLLGITDISLLVTNEQLQQLTTMGLVSIVLFIVAYIWLIVRSLLYSLTVYVAYDNPNMSSLEVVNESARMMKGNRGKIFLLSLSFIGWAILVIFTLGIGYLWLMPYMVVAEVCFYEYLLGKKENNNSDGNVESITEM